MFETFQLSTNVSINVEKFHSGDASQATEEKSLRSLKVKFDAVESI